MHNITLLLTFLLTILATTIMSYVSLITPVGPWIAPILIVCARMLMQWHVRCNESRVATVGYAVAGASAGGIIATACAFSLPAFYYNDPTLVTQLMAQPVLLWGLLVALIGCAAFIGYVCAQWYESTDAVRTLPFALSKLHATMIHDAWSPMQIRRGIIGSVLMVTGELTRMLLCVQVSPLRSTGVLFPIVIAVGYVAGHLLLVPVAVGLSMKLVMQLNGVESALMSVGAGMVIAATVQTMGAMLFTMVGGIKKVRYLNFVHYLRKVCVANVMHGALGVLLCVPVLFGGTLMQAAYVVGATGIAAYCLVTIAGAAGVAPLGRFATFAMVPAVLLFSFTQVQGLLVAVWIEIVGGVCADLMISRKMGQLLTLDATRVKQYQVWGLCLSVLCMATLCVLLPASLGIDTIAAYASRARARALLVQAPAYALQPVHAVGGFLWGIVLHMMRVNVLLAFSGLLMPVASSVGLLLGSCGAYWMRRS
ncbi:MAG: hypothetical protein WCE21_05645 [Candidatus Babeliales bacterium]